MSQKFIQLSKDYARIEKAIHFLRANFKDQPSLKQMAESINVSEYHFQRIFQRWAGISPKKFVQYLTKEYAKRLLKESNVLDTSLDSGLSGPGRLHDLFVNCEAMTPGEYKAKARGLSIAYGFHPTPLGECFIAVTPRGLCELSFNNKKDRKGVLVRFRQSWENAHLYRSQDKTSVYLDQIFNFRGKKGAIKLLFKGTHFQVKVWEALLKIPVGHVTSYQTLAQAIGRPKAARAVGNAVGKNHIAYLIPCHRVIRAEGLLGGYRWGIARKKAILGREAVTRHA